MSYLPKGQRMQEEQIKMRSENRCRLALSVILNVGSDANTELVVLKTQTSAAVKSYLSHIDNHEEE